MTRESVRPSGPVLVACLCADWCSACREYRAVFETLRARHGGGGADFAWIDVEDESDALGDPEIEDFPTLLIAAGESALFFGAVTPPSAERLVAGALEGALAPTSEPDVAALLRRVRLLLGRGGGDSGTA
ncbi:MAG: thioredoxin family protein [Caldimonas sp.]